MKAHVYAYGCVYACGYRYACVYACVYACACVCARASTYADLRYRERCAGVIV